MLCEKMKARTLLLDQLVCPVSSPGVYSHTTCSSLDEHEINTGSVLLDPVIRLYRNRMIRRLSNKAVLNIT